MNVLTLVVTVLMMVAIMTYARLETFLNTRGFELEYRAYMQYGERAFFNQRQTEIYDKSHGGDALVEDNGEWEELDDEEDDDEEGNEAAPANKKDRLNRFLNFAPFVSVKMRLEHPKEYQQLLSLTLKLMDILYRQDPAFETLYIKYPDLNHLILQDLMTSTEHMEPSGKRKSKAGSGKPVSNKLAIANVALQDAELHGALYMMLKGTQKKSDIQEGFPSLFDFITIINKSKPISIFLAPKELLQAIYGPITAQEIIEKRNNLSNGIHNSGLTPQAAQAELERQFQGKQILDLDSSLLNFATSKTRPPKS